MYPVYSENSKKKAVDELVMKATHMFPRIFDASVYRLYGTKKANIYSSLFKNTTPAGIHIFSTVLNKNILVLREFGYEWCSRVCHERDTLCLWEHSGDVGALVHIDQRGGIDVCHILSSKIDLYEDRTKRISMAYNKDALKKQRELSKKAFIDLRHDARETGIHVHSGGKMLKKQELVDTIMERFLGQ